MNMLFSGIKNSLFPTIEHRIGQVGSFHGSQSHHQAASSGICMKTTRSTAGKFPNRDQSPFLKSGAPQSASCGSSRRSARLDILRFRGLHQMDIEPRLIRAAVPAPSGPTRRNVKSGRRREQSHLPFPSGIPYTKKRMPENHRWKIHTGEIKPPSHASVTGPARRTPLRERARRWWMARERWTAPHHPRSHSL